MTCIRHLLTPTEEILCSFIITQDTTLESDEVFALVLKVADDAGNLIALGDNCAVATISTGTSKGANYSIDVTYCYHLCVKYVYRIFASNRRSA